MDIIKNNPFRVLGLPITATDRQISKRVDDLSMFCEMGKAKQYENDFPFFSPPERTTETIQRAASQIELPEQKLFHSIFWFWSGNSVDELVFDILMSGNVQKAQELWEKSVNNSQLESKNYSNFRNLALLEILLSSKNDNSNQHIFIIAASSLVKTFNHNGCHEFIEMIAGVSCKVNTDDVQEHFIDEVVKGINIDSNDIARVFIEAFDSCSDRVRQYVRDKFSGEPLRRLESVIQVYAENDKKDDIDIYAEAEIFFNTAQKILVNIEEVLTKQDMRYKFIADKVANELMSSSVGYFNANHEADDSLELFDKAEAILLWAKRVAAGSGAVEKIETNMQQINDMREQSSQYGNNAEIDEYAGKLIKLIKALPRLDGLSSAQISGLPRNARLLVDKSKQLLASISALSSNEHEAYTCLSNTVVSVVMGMMITYVNETQCYQTGFDVLGKISQMTMDVETRENFVKNQMVLMANAELQAQAKSSSNGCYIATLVYGSYEAQEVLILRQFRDEVLSKTVAGRAFIRVYYKVSPSLVILLKNQMGIQLKIKRILNYFIGRIS